MYKLVGFMYGARFRQKFTLEGAFEFHAFAPLEASRRVTNAIPLGSPLLLPVHTVNCIQTLKDRLLHRVHLVVGYGA